MIAIDPTFVLALAQTLDHGAAAIGQLTVLAAIVLAPWLLGAAVLAFALMVGGR